MADVKRGINLGPPPTRQETTLGALLGEEAERDAIHVAVAPVVAAVPLAPGQHVGFVADDGETVGPTTEPIGIVDPFLRTVVAAGERCYLLLYPRTITSLRHLWTHPAFVEMCEPVVVNQLDHAAVSRAWLRNLADSMGGGMDYEDLMAAADRWVTMEDHTVQHGRESWRDARPNMVEFWHHYEIVTGNRPVDAERWFFCCSC